MAIDRRSFIRSLGSQAVRSVGAAIAMSGQVRQEIADQLLIDETAAPLDAPPRSDPRPLEPGTFTATSIAPSSADKLALGGWAERPLLGSWLAGAIALDALDQRRLPDEAEVTRLESAGEVVTAIWEGVIDGGLATALAAVQTIAMVAARALDAPEPSRRLIISGAARALAGARPDVPLVGQAVRSLIPDIDVPDIPSADVLRAAADTLGETIQAEHRALAAAGAAWLRGRFGIDADLMLVGEFGPAATSSIGTTSAVLRVAADLGMRFRVWVPDGGRSGRGAALLDAAVGPGPIDVRPFADHHLNRVLADHDVRAVLLGTSWVAEDGTLAGQLGCLAAALLAHERAIPVVGVASRSMLVRTSTLGQRFMPSARTGYTPLELIAARLVDVVLTDAGPIGATELAQLA
jgi:methylthioribose-1-phosphate isomerase